MSTRRPDETITVHPEETDAKAGVATRTVRKSGPVVTNFVLPASDFNTCCQRYRLSTDNPCRLS